MTLEGKPSLKCSSQCVEWAPRNAAPRQPSKWIKGLWLALILYTQDQRVQERAGKQGGYKMAQARFPYCLSSKIKTHTSPAADPERRTSGNSECFPKATVRAQRENKSLGCPRQMHSPDKAPQQGIKAGSIDSATAPWSSFRLASAALQRSHGDPTDRS